jgi:hypothetical protein
MKLIAAASSALEVPADTVVRWFGRSVLPPVAAAAYHAAHDVCYKRIKGEQA